MRILDIIKSDFNSDKLKLEEELERVINDTQLTTENKILGIKKILREIAITEASFDKFKNYIDTSNTNN